jgi:hypothetical protein
MHSPVTTKPLSARAVRRSDGMPIRRTDVARRRSLDGIKHIESTLNVQMTACIGVHSFLMLCLAIYLGPVPKSNTPKQLFLGVTLSTMGLLVGVLQLAIGRNAVRGIRHLIIKVRSWDQKRGSPDFQIEYDSFLDHGQIERIRNTNELIGRGMPLLLTVFWVIVSFWVLWRW